MRTRRAADRVRAQNGRAAGMGRSAADTTIPAKGKAIVPTDISIAIPEGCYGASATPSARGAGAARARPPSPPQVNLTARHRSAWVRTDGTGRVAPRSGLAVKHFLDVGAGVIDADYRGAVGVVMFNFSDVDYKGAAGPATARTRAPSAGRWCSRCGPCGVFASPADAVAAKDRVAQLILERIVTPAVEEVETLPDTARGAGGFGSTGKN